MHNGKNIYISISIHVHIPCIDTIHVCFALSIFELYDNSKSQTPTRKVFHFQHRHLSYYATECSAILFHRRTLQY